MTPIGIGERIELPSSGGGGGGGGGGAGTLLATKYFAPATEADYGLGGVTTLAPVDATNMTLAFTVPDNGIVDVDCDFFAFIGANSDFMSVGLLDHTSGNLVGFAWHSVQLGQNAGGIRHVRWHLTGLTPGALQLDFAACASGSGAIVIAAAGSTAKASTNTDGPFLMQAFSSL